MRREYDKCYLLVAIEYGDKLCFKRTRSSFLFKIGSVGFVAGFLAWFIWLFLVILNLVAYRLGYLHLNIMSGIFFQSGPYRLIVQALLTVSFALGSFSCFGLKYKHRSNLAMICGIVYLAIFTILCYSLLESYLFQNYVGMRLFPLFLNLGLLFWGLALLEVRKYLPHQRLGLLVAIIFILIAFLFIWLWQAIAYWGFEFWFVLLGWLYAIGALVTAILFFQVSRPEN